MLSSPWAFFCSPIAFVALAAEAVAQTPGDREGDLREGWRERDTETDRIDFVLHFCSTVGYE